MSKNQRVPLPITRREALSRIAGMLGGTIVGAEFILTGTRLEGKEPGEPFTAAELALMDEIGDTIIPTTDTPGAKAAGIGAFMALVVSDCYDARNEQLFRAGLIQVDAACVKQCGKIFVSAAPAERTTLLGHLDNEERAKSPGQPAGYFSLIKQLTVLGYFTSEIGCMQALRFSESPGFYSGNAPYEKGDRAWFNSVGRAFRAGW